ncbi:hypothetical protein [Kitasatospora sp. CB02891]|uniref:hypothetical protein n=1 Tax=Kitasatospora sp. CB02891 TaxID=2020329 RepID=UPI000C27AFF7|nr:hypothetical protein [Kitasatospora sp. CB02891]PJN22409.1 hypothetical protein CG736_28260 [Kitasatospora sp. CB02891]
MPRTHYSYQPAPGERVTGTHFDGTAQELADEIARDWRAGGGTPDVKVWDGPITELPAATAR